MSKITVGLTGTGSFSTSFLPLLQAHPWVKEVRIAELRPERRAEIQQKFGIKTAYANHEEMCASDVDAVLIFTERMHHFGFAKQALLAGKHVYTAVPMANTVEEIEELVALVKETGLTYMMGETSIYYPSCVYCRDRYQGGDFGRFVYGEGEYYHDMADSTASFYKIYKAAHGDQWRQYAGYPPMFYPTHSVAMVLGVTGARMTHVTCMGLDETDHEDQCWGPGKNFWDNPFSNQTALFQTSDGGVARINEFRRVGISHGNHVRLSIFGNQASFEEQSGTKYGVTMFTTLDSQREDPSEIIRCEPHQESGPEEEYLGVALVHNVARLPESYRGKRNGHYGAHQFLMDDYIKACVRGKIPPINVWAAARYNVPGLVAHESCLKEGERLKVPDFGDAPDNPLDLSEVASSP